VPRFSASWAARIETPSRPRGHLRWYRESVAAKYDGSRARGAAGSRPIRGEKVKHLAMARENPTWGYTRLRGALWNLGFDLGRSTIQRILKEHGIEPAPLRGRTMAWKTFLKTHWGTIAAADFFSVEYSPAEAWFVTSSCSSSTSSNSRHPPCPKCPDGGAARSYSIAPWRRRRPAGRRPEGHKRQRAALAPRVQSVREPRRTSRPRPGDP
jgi:hypothetical protein